MHFKVTESWPAEKLWECVISSQDQDGTFRTNKRVL